MKIDVQGNSGCVVKIENINNKQIVVKYTDNEKYAERLLAQGEKQLNTVVNIDSIKIPTIYRIASGKNNTTIEMEYISSKNFVSFFELSDIVDIKKFVTIICLFIDNEISSCKMQQVPSSLILKKVSNVIDNAYENEYIKNNAHWQLLLSRILNFINNICIDNEFFELPIGVCHGDLTLSNILFSNDDYYLIDFLDSYIETPLQDICKLRQDTKFKWSTLMYDGNFDKSKFNIICDYIDTTINNYFSNYDFYNKFYDLFQLINILRIVPYIKSKKVSDYLYYILTDIIMMYEKV